MNALTLLPLPTLVNTTLATPAIKPEIPDEPALAAKADAGDLQACARYGKLLCEQALNLNNPEQGMEARFLKGIGYLERAANAGNNESILILAVVYAGIDKRQSAHWAQKAADAGEPQGHRMLAKLASDEKMAAKHRVQAVALAERRADARHQEDWLYLHEVYSNGQPGIPRDPAKANHYLRLAADAGNIQARTILGSNNEFHPTEEETARHTAYLRTHPGITDGTGLTEETALDFRAATTPIDQAISSYLQTVYPGAEQSAPSIKRPGRKHTKTISTYLLPNGRVLQLHTLHPAHIQPTLPKP